MEEIIVRREQITPERARQLLETISPKQRLRRKHHVEYLRNEMTRGFWKLNGETIKISKEGKLVDGQHRLEAIIKSGIPIETFVVFGIDEDAYNSIDTGMRRNAADALRARGETNAAALASAIGIGFNIDAKRYYAVQKRLRSSIETEKYLDKNKRIRESVSIASGHYTKLIHPSIVAALHYLFLKRGGDQALLDRFVVGLMEGFSPMKEGNFHKFREKLIANQASIARVRRNTILAWGIVTLNATLAKTKLTRLDWNPRTDDFPEPVVLS